MDEQKTPDLPQEEGYVPRPRWQVWAARVGVVLTILLFIAQCLHIMGAGLR